MKGKILFVSIVVLMLFSRCTYNHVDDSTRVPYGVMDTMLTIDTLLCDNVYVIETEKNHYYFNEDKQLVKKYLVNENLFSMNGFLFIGIIIFVFIIGYSFGANSY